MPKNPAVPSFDHVRLATLDDLPRIATVAAAGFFWSPTFQFQRPYHAEFPEDTLLSYRSEYDAAIRDPATVVLVAEDDFREAECERVYDALRSTPMYNASLGPKRRVVVGISSLYLRPGSSYIGKFQGGCKVIRAVTLSSDRGADSTEADGIPGQPEVFTNLERDCCARANQVYSAATNPAKTKYLAGLMRLSTLAVHPAYWRRGHASRLLDWCTRLADLEDAPLGVSAAPMGARLAVKAGFEERELIRIEPSSMHPDALCGGVHIPGLVELWVAVRPQGSTEASDESAACSDSPATSS
ncbi:hypothetical protein BS50DRAFT_89484 [Corynespora cassiicola Philippines]|uniref:N-acetyltransferase domain-containing protein n=1 Tax=Corynespora cassiicola Philippines TaxID=1448308 RepID=A0A2T2NEE1_CORCC|nr:hypothetical protein BS50DRAFT_89484 [Corynespora cassiicola Philippines]